MAFPPRPRPFHGRASELATLAAACRTGLHPRLALVGPGGSGKSTLAAALGHRLRRDYPGGLEWVRVGAWDHRTLIDMLAIRLQVPLGRLDERQQRLAAIRRRLRERGPTFIVLDNHEDDREMARFLNALAGTPAFWLLTARRCLLAGVSVFPVVSPLVTVGRSPFPAVAELTALLRWNALALDVSDALVRAGAVTAPALGRWLVEHGVGRVAAIAHEDASTRAAAASSPRWLTSRAITPTRARSRRWRAAAGAPVWRACVAGTSCRSRCPGASPSTPPSGTRWSRGRGSTSAAPWSTSCGSSNGIRRGSISNRRTCSRRSTTRTRPRTSPSASASPGCSRGWA
jgi:hypothetical protein